MRIDLRFSHEDKQVIRSAASFVLASIFYVMALLLLKAVL